MDPRIRFDPHRNGDGPFLRARWWLPLVQIRATLRAWSRRSQWSTDPRLGLIIDGEQNGAYSDMAQDTRSKNS